MRNKKLEERLFNVELFLNTEIERLEKRIEDLERIYQVLEETTTIKKIENRNDEKKRWLRGYPEQTKNR